MENDEKIGTESQGGLSKWIDAADAARETAGGEARPSGENAGDGGAPGGSDEKAGQGPEHLGGAKRPEGLDLRVSAGPLFAAVLLGLCELIFIGVSANYLSMRSVGIALLFMAQGVFMAALSVAALSWGVMKIKHGKEAALLGCVKAGISLGVCAAVAVCALAGIFAFAGMGPDRLAQKFYFETGAWQAVANYIGIFAGIMLLYATAGAIAGAAAKLLLAAGRKKISEAVAYLHSKPEPETEIAG